MLIVLNLTKLSLIIGLGFLYFLGLGWILIGILPSPTFLLKQNLRKCFIHILPLLLVSGMIANYAITLIVQQLTFGLIIGMILSIIGLLSFGYRFFNARTTGSTKKAAGKWIGISLLFILYLTPILFEPLDIWDARSIWFFHAKMIFKAGSTGIAAGWQHPSILFSHVDYPNLIPVMAAQIAHVLSYWNEYVPKTSLAFILTPAFLWLFTFMRYRFSFLLLIFLPFSLSIWLWNGLMDGFLAIYFSVSMLLFGRYMQKKNDIDLISSIICLTMLLYLKNEGQLAFIAGIISIIISLFIHKINRIPLTETSFLSRWTTVLVIILLPLLTWSLYKYQWGLSNDLEIGKGQSLSYIIERLKDKSFILIFQKTFGEINNLLLLLGMSLFIFNAQRLKIPGRIFSPILSSIIYYSGLFFIYLMTPHDLGWHLHTSAYRTMLSVSGCIFIACYFLLDELETRMSIAKQENTDF